MVSFLSYTQILHEEVPDYDCQQIKLKAIMLSYCLSMMHEIKEWSTSYQFLGHFMNPRRSNPIVLG